MEDSPRAAAEAPAPQEEVPHADLSGDLAGRGGGKKPLDWDDPAGPLRARDMRDEETDEEEVVPMEIEEEFAIEEHDAERGLGDDPDADGSSPSFVCHAQLPCTACPVRSVQ